MFYTLSLQFNLKNGQKRRRWSGKQSSATIMISVDGKGTVFSIVVKITKGILWIEILKKENFKKDLMNLIETNHQINMISDHSVSSNNHQINMISDHSISSNNHQINMISDHSVSSNNHQINMISDHSVSSNNLLKNHLNVKCFNMFLTL